MRVLLNDAVPPPERANVNVPTVLFVVFILGDPNAPPLPPIERVDVLLGDKSPLPDAAKVPFNAKVLPPKDKVPSVSVVSPVIVTFLAKVTPLGLSRVKLVKI